MEFELAELREAATIQSAAIKDILAMLEGMRSEQSAQASSFLRALEAVQDKQRTMFEGTSVHFDSIFNSLADLLTVHRSRAH